MLYFFCFCLDHELRLHIRLYFVFDKKKDVFSKEIIFEKFEKSIKIFLYGLVSLLTTKKDPTVFKSC
jgi:hypothetical protein